MDKVMKTSSINKERINRYLKEGKRFDGRQPDEFRNLQIETGVSLNAEGSARVKLGNTDVIVGVKLALGEPYPDSLDKGNFMVNAELSPMSSPRFESGPPKFPVIELGRVIDRGLRESGFLDWEGLCLVKGKKVWTIFVDIYSINDDGNLLDASGIAAVAALMTAKLPIYDAETETVDHKHLSDKPVPLKAGVFPLFITVNKLAGGILVDPTREEEDLVESRITIGSSYGIISSLQKGESLALTSEEIGQALDMADSVWKAIFKNIEEQIK